MNLDLDAGAGIAVAEGDDPVAAVISLVLLDVEGERLGIHPARQGPRPRPRAAVLPGDPTAGFRDGDVVGYVRLKVDGDGITIHVHLEVGGVCLEHGVERLIDLQLVRELLVSVDDGDSGFTVLVGLVLLDVEREGGRVQASCLVGAAHRHPVAGVGNLHLEAHVALQLGADGVAIHRCLNVGLVEEQSGVAGLLDGDVARYFGDGVSQRNGVGTGIVGGVGLYRNHQLGVVDIKTGQAPRLFV